MELNDIWRHVRLDGLDYPDYEVSLTGEVRRETAANGTRPGKVIGYSKDGSAYERLGLRREGQTTYARRDHIMRDSYAELAQIFGGAA